MWGKWCPRVIRDPKFSNGVFGVSQCRPHRTRLLILGVELGIGCFGRNRAHFERCSRAAAIQYGAIQSVAAASRFLSDEKAGYMTVWLS